MIFSSLRNLPPFCSTIRISLPSTWRTFKNSYLQGEEADINMIVHEADVDENVH